jgi:hypothetical protein
MIAGTFRRTLLMTLCIVDVPSIQNTTLTVPPPMAVLRPDASAAAARRLSPVVAMALPGFGRSDRSFASMSLPPVVAMAPPVRVSAPEPLWVGGGLAALQKL